MRKKSYYTETDTVLNLYTFGKEFQLEDGTEYTGLYHRYNSTGEVFTKAKWDKNQSKPLFDYIAPVKNNIVYKTLNNINLKGFSLPKNSIIFPNSENRKIGYFMRYFLKKITDNIILEVNQQQYDDWNSNKIDKNLYDGLSFKWYISGPLDDIKTGSVITLGVISKNRKELADANLRMPGITESFSSLTEYYLSSDLVVPKDING
jgi:hypothetical protein